MAGLTPKQEAFAVAYFETGNAAEAYRRAYDVKAATTHSTIYVAAAELLRHPKITLRIEALRTAAAELAIYTVNDAFREYEEARKLALQVDNPSAAVSAVAGKVKLFGLEPAVKAKLEHTGKDGGPIEQRVTLDPTKLSTATLQELMGAMPDEASGPDESGSAGD